MTLDINRPDLTVGVVGTGAMGRGIAQVTAQGGIKAIMFDAAAGGAAKAKAAILDTLKGLVTKGRLTDADVAKTDANLGVAESLSDLKGCHVVVEAVFENLEVKQKLFGELEAVVAPDAILASNTSSIRIASIARALKHRERVCGMHYFNPVPLMKLVEVIRAADTAQWVVAAMTALGQRQTRVPVVVGDTPGFLVNLGGTAIGTEGLRIMQEGRASPRPGRRRDARHLRLPHGAVRADGPHRHRRELPGAQDHLRGLLPRPAHDAQPLPREPLCGRPARPQDRRRLVRLRRQGRQDRSRRRPRDVGRAGRQRRGHGSPQHEAHRPAGGRRRPHAGRRRRREPDPGGADRQGLHDDGDRARPRSQAHRRGRPHRRHRPSASPS